MKIHLIKKIPIEDYCKNNPKARVVFNDWLVKLSKSDWNSPGDIKLTFSSADLLGKSSQRVVFDIGSNNYRIICKYLFGQNLAHLFIYWIGTHAEYDKLNKAGNQYTINLF